jgi:hypothetical protein
LRRHYRGRAGYRGEEKQMREKNRKVVVVDRGWIFAGDVTERDGYTYLERAINVGRWSGGQWFAGVIADPKKNVTLLPLPSSPDGGPSVEIPDGAVIFRIPVADDWGL